MPILDLEPTNLTAGPTSLQRESYVTPGALDVEFGSDAPEAPSWGKTFGAAFRQDNLVGAAASAESLSGEADPSFNPWDSIKGTKYEPRWSSFVEIRNPADADTMKRKLDQEDEDRRLLSAAPLYKSLPAQLVAGALDLPTLLPGGAFVRGAKGGVSIARSAGTVAAAAGASTALQEAGLQSLQETRTLAESAVNIGASVLLGGILGAGGSALLSKAEWAEAVAKLERELAGEGGVTTPVPVPESKIAPPATASKWTGTSDEVLKKNVQEWVSGLAGKVDFDHLTEAVNRFGKPLQEDTAFYRGDSNFRPNFADEKKVISVSDRPGGESFSISRNEDALEEVGGADTPTLRLSEITVPKGTKVLDVASVAPAKAEELERMLPPGKFVFTGSRLEPMPGKNANWSINSYRYEPFDTGAGSPGLSSAGAAAAGPTDIRSNSIAGELAATVANSTSRLNPALRLLHSPSAAARETGTQLFENSLYLKKNFEGVASEPAVETLMKEWNSGLAQAIRMTDDAFLDYRKAGGDLTRTEFREAVGRAMRRGDEAEDPFVTKVAKSWRAKVFDPLKEAAIEAKLLPEDVTVETAASYFSRMWNRNKLIAQEGRFKGIVQEWVSREMPKWIAGYDNSVERRLNPVRQEIEELEMAKLRRGEELKGRVDEVEAGEFSESDIRRALRIVEGGAPKPKGVKTLTQFVVESGGVVDAGGELASRGINTKSRPGLVRTNRKVHANDAGGWGLDDMAFRAYEEGYFPHHTERPSIDEFLEALNDDFHKVRAVLKRGEEDAYRMTELVHQLEMDLERIGVNTGAGKASKFATSDEVKGMVARVYKAMDAEADKKIAALKEKLQSREVDLRIDRESRFEGDGEEMSRDIANEVFAKLTGKSDADSVRPEFVTIKARGPLKERTFNIPDELVEEFLENDVEQVGRRYARVMGADVEIARKFGKVDMEDQIAKIHEDYARLRKGIKSEKKLQELGKREADDIRDITALRDLLRGQNLYSHPVEQNFAKVTRSFNHLNYLRSMGEVAIASLTETVRPAMVHGLRPYMQTLGKLGTGLNGIKLSVREGQLAGNVSERVLGTRLATLSEIVDPYASRGPIESFLENMTNVASKWNGIRLLTDMQKSIAAVMTQDRIIGSSTDFGKIKPSEKAYLAYLGIDEGMAGRISKQFKDHGEVVDGVKVANTESWTDQVARRAYRAAINKDVDSIITTKGVADVPLFANTPTGRAFLQFKSFALASHQRVLLRGLQESQARFVSGLIAMSTIGMMATWLKAQSGNRDEKLADFNKNPGWWIAEGLDKSGIFAVPMELANTFEKATGYNTIKSPIKAFDEGSRGSQRIQNRSLAGALMGPSAGFIDDIGTVGGIPKRVVEGEEVTQGQKSAAERLLPFNSYLGIRQMMRYLVNSPD